MEKKEARVKCSGCGTHYKIKFPVSDKPVRFQCKKCGKTLAIRMKAPDQIATGQVASAEPAPEMMPQFERTRLPDWQPPQEPSAPAQPGGVDDAAASESASAPSQSSTPEDRRWLVLADEQVKGPFNNDEITDMIKTRFINSETSLRMGQRPWIKAAQVPDFRFLFPEMDGGYDQSAQSRPAQKTGEHTENLIGSVKAQLIDAIPYPFTGGNWQPLAIFAAIAFVLSIVLVFDFVIGLPVAIVGWILLFGYLADLMKTSSEASEKPPPSIDFSAIREMVSAGMKIFCVMAVYSLIPVSICLLFMIAFFLNDMELLGYVFIAVTIVVYVMSLYLASAGLLILGKSQQLGQALNPSIIIDAAAKSGGAYIGLGFAIIIIGIVCMLSVLASVFVTDLLPLGSVFASLIMTLVLSYGNFMWFHLLGIYLKMNVIGANQIPTPAPIP
ncbi:MAG: DUF4013 domain-containing protein [Desulfomonilaceae bacterium]